MDRAQHIQQQIEYQQQCQQQVLNDIQRTLYEASHVSDDRMLSVGCPTDEGVRLELKSCFIAGPPECLWSRCFGGRDTSTDQHVEPPFANTQLW
jgi:hypothetical protein